MKIYLNHKKIRHTDRNLILDNGQSQIPLPAIGFDNFGIFLPCGAEEAQEHLDNAWSSLLEALGHSAGMGLFIEVPPMAIYEGYQAVEAWKEAAQEYNAYLQDLDRWKEN